MGYHGYQGRMLAWCFSMDALMSLVQPMEAFPQPCVCEQSSTFGLFPPTSIMATVLQVKDMTNTWDNNIIFPANTNQFNKLKRSAFITIWDEFNPVLASFL